MTSDELNELSGLDLPDYSTANDRFRGLHPPELGQETDII
jgi:hypothetical protein